MKQEIKIVLGMAFGDEGKGNTVQYLCKQAIATNKTVAVVRFCGGAQAGHRVVHNGISHVCSSFGSGTLLGIPTIYINPGNTFIDPIALVNEYNVLLEEGVENPEIPTIDWENSRFTTPYDIVANIKDQKILSDGTCGMGIYNTYKRYKDSLSLHKSNISEAENYYGYVDACLSGMYNTALRKIGKLKSKSYNLDDFEVLIFEGTQGLLLDMEHGFMPHCTPSKVGLNGVPSKYITKDTEVYLVSRTYLTRHGNGWEPANFLMDEYINIPKEASNFDDGHQGKFKVGRLDTKLLKRAIDRHCLDNYPCKFNLVWTHCDCLKRDKHVPTVSNYTKYPTTLEAVTEFLQLDFKEVLYFNSEEA